MKETNILFWVMTDEKPQFLFQGKGVQEDDGTTLNVVFSQSALHELEKIIQEYKNE